jgi:hypothetical protein
MAKDIFKRLSAGRPPSPEGAVGQAPRRREDPKLFLKDILTNGPAPVSLVIERAANRGFTKRQITYAREQMKIIALKGPGLDSGWFWVLPHDNRSVPTQQVTPKTGVRRGRPE